MPLIIAALALGAFCIGTTKFVIIGLLPDIARSLSISIEQVGSVVGYYSIGVMAGAPLMALITYRLSRKTSLLLLMGLFIVGNFMAALAQQYHHLVVARLVTSMAHAGFFGVGAVEVAGLVSPKKKASAIALMLMGFPVANILGVPISCAIGHATRWQVPFFLITGLGIVTLGALAFILPNRRTQVGSLEPQAKQSFKREWALAFKEPAVWLALLTMGVSGTASYSMFTYITPVLERVSGVTHEHTPWVLLFVGISLTLGGVIGGKLAEMSIKPALIGLHIAMTCVHLMLLWTIHTPVMGVISFMIWGMCAFCMVPIFQANSIQIAKSAPTVISTLNVAALNLGGALGAWIGGFFLSYGMSLAKIPLISASFSALALLIIMGSKVTRSEDEVLSSELTPV